MAHQEILIIYSMFAVYPIHTGFLNYGTHTGLEKEVSDWLSSHELVNEMENDLKLFIEKWIPHIISSQRAYLTISIGCTGGHHRSVYLIDKLAKHFETFYERFCDCSTSRVRLIYSIPLFS